MSNPNILAQLEAGIIAALQSALGSSVREVLPLPDEWDEESIRRMLVRTPAAGVGFGGADPIVNGMDPLAVRTWWAVAGITSHAANHTAQRRGDALDIGAYQIITVAAQALNGKVIEGSTLLLKRIENAYDRDHQRAGISVLVAYFWADVDLQVDAADYSGLANFAQFVADIGGLAAVDQELPQ